MQKTAEQIHVLPLPGHQARPSNKDAINRSLERINIHNKRRYIPAKLLGLLQDQQNCCAGVDGISKPYHSTQIMIKFYTAAHASITMTPPLLLLLQIHLKITLQEECGSVTDHTSAVAPIGLNAISECDVIFDDKFVTYGISVLTVSQ